MRHLLRFTRDESGVTTINFALAVVAAVGAGGAAVDYGLAASSRSTLQSQADAAALTAARTIGLPEAAAVAENHLRSAVGDPAGLVVQGSATDETVTVTATRKAKTAMIGVVGIREVTVAASATAIRASKGPPICILSLSRTAQPGVSFSGNTNFSAEGCAVQSNSKADGSISRQGSASASADKFCAVGTVAGGLTPAKNDCIERQDPYRGIAPPTTAGTCLSAAGIPDPAKGNKAVRYVPGVYCNTIDVKDSATFAPGVYVLKDGLKINAKADAVGSGVTFYLTGAGADFDINGGGTVNLSAPLAGTYQGLLLWVDPAAGAGTNKINGNSDMQLVGAIYAPSQRVEFLGNSAYGQASRFMPVIADTVAFTGSSEVTIRADTTVKADTTAMDTNPPLPTLDTLPRLTL
jgi:hypothetical protein